MRRKLNEVEREAYRLALSEIEKSETEIRLAEIALREKLAPQRENIIKHQIHILNLLTGLCVGMHINITDGMHRGKSAVIVGVASRMGSMRWEYALLVDGKLRSKRNDLMPSQSYEVVGPEVPA